VYKDIYQYLGKWEWDIVRSARIVLDVGLNYIGWTREQAMLFWKKNIKNQDDIAVREIDRMLRWPAQVLSYKVGENEILNLKKACEKKLGSNFDIKRFHSTILNRGSLPLSVLKEIVAAECEILHRED
jgi:uncharacterized protein (DUF885 family)